MKRTAFFPGSFDPFTNGHLALVNKALCICDEIVIAIGVHADKKRKLTAEKRKKLIEKVFVNNNNVKVDTFDGLVVEAAKKAGANVILRGVRNTTDLEYEMQMAEMNETMMENIPTIFLPAIGTSRAISATLVRQITEMGGDVSQFVPKEIIDDLKNKE